MDVDTVLPKFKPSWIEGQVVEDSGVRPGFSSVKVNLPVLPDRVARDYNEFETEWRRLGTDAWNRTRTSTSSSNVTLPEELGDGSYEVRVRATGNDGPSLYTTALRFPLLSRGKSNRIKKCGL